MSKPLPFPNPYAKEVLRLNIRVVEIYHERPLYTVANNALILTNSQVELSFETLYSSHEKIPAGVRNTNENAKDSHIVGTERAEKSIESIAKGKEANDFDSVAYWLHPKHILGKHHYGNIIYANVLHKNTNKEYQYKGSLVEWMVTKDEVAVKEYEMELMRDKLKQNFERGRGLRLTEDPLSECSAMQIFAAAECRLGSNDKNVTHQIDLLVDGSRIYSIMPRYGGSLLNKLPARSNLKICIPENTVRKWMKDILIAVRFLHEDVGVCHRDISPDNVMVTCVSEKCTVIDFGMCLRVPHVHIDVGRDQNMNFSSNRRQAVSMQRPKPPAGKLPYMAPELWKSNVNEIDGFAIDIYSIGVLTLKLLLGDLPPIRKVDHPNYVVKLLDYLQLKKNYLSQDAFRFIENMLCLNAEVRMNVGEALRHNFIVGANQNEESEEHLVPLPPPNQDNAEYDISKIAFG